jgi:hypothetical protein
MSPANSASSKDSLGIFTGKRGFGKIAEPILFRLTTSENADLNRSALPSRNATAPLLLHSPVNELHSIEIKEHTNLFFLLTQKIEGVQHNCSLTVSEVFPVGAASGGQAKSPSA